MAAETHTDNDTVLTRAADPADKVPWKPLTGVLYAAFVFVVAQIMASLLVVVYPHLRGWSSAAGQDWVAHSIVAQFWFVLFAETLTFGAIWWFVHARRASLRAIGWLRPRWWDIVWALNGILVYFILYYVVLLAAQQLIPSLNVNQKQELGFDHVAGHTNLLLAFLSLVVLPPIAEETVFRGFVFSGLRGRLSWVWAAIITSMLFASAHLEFGSGQPLLWTAAIDTFILSLVLCYLRQKTNSLWPGILVHALKNGVAFMVLYIIRVSI